MENCGLQVTRRRRVSISNLNRGDLLNGLSSLKKNYSKISKFDERYERLIRAFRKEVKFRNFEKTLA